MIQAIVLYTAAKRVSKRIGWGKTLGSGRRITPTEIPGT
jgi:hypothetical protein